MPLIDIDLTGAPTPVTDYVPDSVSDRQFWQQLALDGEITELEALAAVKTGDIPDRLDQIITANFDAASQFDIRMKVSGAREFRLSDPVTPQLAALLNKTWGQMRDLWKRASGL